jgi:tetratricopeptide (TPR) repeat protein
MLKNLFCIALILFPLLSCHSLIPSPEEETIEDLTPYLSASLTPKQQVSLHLTREGQEALLRGALSEASNTLAKAIDLDPANPFAFYYLGEIHYQRSQYQQSLTFLEKAKGLFRNNHTWLSKVYTLMGINYEAMGDLTDARDRFKEALDEDRGNILAEDGLSRVNHLGHQRGN